LLVAAAAYLTLFKGDEKFSREQLVATAKEARAWRSNYGVQTSININRMLESGELIEKSKNVYDLSQKKIADLEQRLRDR
jgi:predicted transcriptional regulator